MTRLNKLDLSGKLHRLFLLLLWAGLVFLFLFSCYLISFGCLTQLTGLLVLVAGAWLAVRTKKIAVLLTTVLIWGATSIVFLAHSVRSYNRTRDEYMARIRSGGELSVREKSNVYLLNVFMSLCALPLYPEIGMESLLMIVPAKNGERHFESDFFLGSKLVQTKFKHLKSGQSDWVKWSAQTYLMGHQEARYSLALNPCRITLIQDGNTRIYEARVPVTYPDESLVTLIGWPLRIQIEEGLFGYLQRVGWLHPYEAIWRHREIVNLND